VKGWEAIGVLARHLDDALVVSCNGYPSRELWAIAERPANFYMIGSMGLASAIGLGLAIARPERRVVVLDGDGNLLMAMGTLANAAAARPRNYYHVVIDNGAYASTGAQKTVSRAARLENVAAACGYTHASRVRQADDLERAVRDLFDGPGPAILVADVEPGTLEKLPRVGLEPPELARRFAREAQAGIHYHETR
jgi:sulfopyruvate decarboxylase beta subunit